MKKLIPLLLVTLLITALTSCGITEDTLTFHNASDYHIDCIAIAPEADVLASDEMILFFDYELDFESLLAPKSTLEFSFEIPNDKLDDTWYLHVSGAPEGFLEMYVKEIEAGAIFSDGTWGFTINFDSEAKNFTLTPLGESDV